MGFLKSLVIIMGVLIMVATGVLVYGFMNRISSDALDASDVASQDTGQVPDHVDISGYGACRIKTAQSHVSRTRSITTLTLSGRAPECRTVLHIDMVSGRVTPLRLY